MCPTGCGIVWKKLGEDMFAIGKLIKKVVGEDQEKKRAVAMSIASEGTWKEDTAFRRLAELMNRGVFEDVDLEKLRAVLGVERALFYDAVADTREQIRLEEVLENAQKRLAFRKGFEPHIFMVGERKSPSQITMFGLTGGNRNRIISFESSTFKHLSIEEQFDVVRLFIKKHQDEKAGVIPFFGKAISYRYCTTPDGDGVEFNPQGEIVPCDRENKTYRGDARVWIG